MPPRRRLPPSATENHPIAKPPTEAPAVRSVATPAQASEHTPPAHVPPTAHKTAPKLPPVKAPPDEIIMQMVPDREFEVARAQPPQGGECLFNSLSLGVREMLKVVKKPAIELTRAAESASWLRFCVARSLHEHHLETWTMLAQGSAGADYRFAKGLKTMAELRDVVRGTARPGEYLGEEVALMVLEQVLGIAIKVFDNSSQELKTWNRCVVKGGRQYPTVLLTLHSGHYTMRSVHMPK